MATPQDAVSLEAAVAKLQALKEEHRPILAAINGDPGIDPDVRQMLIAHLVEEEDEQIARIGQLSGGKVSATPSTASPSASRRAGLTVGSLRSEAPAGWTGGTVGAIRRS